MLPSSRQPCIAIDLHGRQGRKASYLKTCIRHWQNEAGRWWTTVNWQGCDARTCTETSSIGTYSNSRYSPPLELPYRFRSSGIDACDASECFLFSYDLHRHYAALSSSGNASKQQQGPKIYMNPAVKVAYSRRWWIWHTIILRTPIVKWWLGKP